MEKPFKNTLLELSICMENLNSCPSALQKEKIQLIIKAAIKRTYYRAFSDKGVSEKVQQNILEMLKILEACPRIKTMNYLSLEQNLKELEELKKLRSVSGWLKSLLVSFKVNSLYNEIYLLIDIISGLKIRYLNETIAAIRQVREDVESYTFIDGDELI